MGAIAKALSDNGYTPSGVHSYGDARRRLDTSVPDVLVVSVELEAYNGLQLAMHCARSHPATRVIVMGPASAALEHDAYELGASAYMRRPLAADALIERVKALEPLGRSGGPEQLPRHLHATDGLPATA